MIFMLFSIKKTNFVDINKNRRLKINSLKFKLDFLLSLMGNKNIMKEIICLAPKQTLGHLGCDVKGCRGRLLYLLAIQTKPI